MNKKISSELTAYERWVKRAVGVKDPHQYGVNGKPLACPICGHDRFDIVGEVPVAKWGLICAECGHLALFLKTPELL
jgi:hypothetical protein